MRFMSDERSVMSDDDQFQKVTVRFHHQCHLLISAHESARFENPLSARLSWVMTIFFMSDDARQGTFFGWFLTALFASKTSPTTLFLLEGLYTTKNWAGTRRGSWTNTFRANLKQLILNLFFNHPRSLSLTIVIFFLSQECSWVWVGECLIQSFNSSIVRLSELGLGFKHL